jgi:hypothetical protein
MYRAAELRALLDRSDLTLEWLSASSGVSTGLERTVVSDDRGWQLLWEFELEACRQPGYLDAGTHLIAAVRRRVGTAPS